MRRRSGFSPWPLVGAILLACAALAPEGASKAVIFVALGSFYTLFLVRVARPDFIRPGLGTFMSLDTSFLVLYYIVYFLPYQMWLFGISDLATSGYLYRTYSETANAAALMAAAGAVFFVVGFDLAGLRAVRKPVNDLSERRASELRSRASFTSAGRNIDLWLAAGLPASIVLYLGLGLRSAGEGRYTDSASGGPTADAVALGIVVLCCLSLALTVARKARSEPVGVPLLVADTIAIWWAVRLLTLGDRNSFLLIAVALVGGYVTYLRATSRLTLVALLLGGLVLYNAVELTRGDERSQSLSGIWSSGLAGDSVNSSGETSFNVSTVAFRAAIAEIPDQVPYGYGRYKAVGIAGVLPFVRGQFLDPAGRNTSADVLDSILLPPTAGWSVGTNVLSDTYADFGIPGVPVVLAILGGFAGWVRRRAIEYPLDPSRAVMYMLTLSVYTQLPRYSVDFPIRILLLAAATIWLAKNMTPRRSSRTDRRETSRG